MFQRVLITGADGFLGRHLTKYLVDQGAEVWAGVYPMPSSIKKFAGMPHVHTLAFNLEQVSLFRDQLPEGIDIVYHFAWNGARRVNWNNFDMQMRNLKITMDMLEAVAEKHARKFVLPAAVYEYCMNAGPIDTKASPTPVDAYSSVKASLRYLCAEYCKQKGMEFIYPVLANVYAQDLKDPWIYQTIDKLLKKEKPLYEDLSGTADFLYIDDAVSALTLVGEKGVPFQMYAIGSGDNWQMKHYMETIRDIVDPDAELGIGELKGDTPVPSFRIDSSAIRNDCGFYPETDFHTGVRKVLEVLQKQTD